MESASSKAATTAKRHYLAALGVSLALSLLFWVVIGEFNTVSFVLSTTIAALLGSSIGLVSNRKVWVSVAATIVIQLLITAITFFVI